MKRVPARLTREALVLSTHQVNPGSGDVRRPVPCTAQYLSALTTALQSVLGSSVLLEKPVSLSWEACKLVPERSQGGISVLRPGGTGAHQEVLGSVSFLLPFGETREAFYVCASMRPR